MYPEIAFITGASRGIGLAIAEEYAKAGIHMAINARTEEELAAQAKRLSETYHITCLPMAGDASDFSCMEQVFSSVKKELGNISILVNNAGISHIGLLTDMSPAEWNQIIGINLTSVFNCCKLAVPQMLHRQKGRIINISSVWGTVGASCETAYSASKGGVNAFTKALAKELAPAGVAVNAIACGVIDTKMNDCFSETEKRSLEDEIPAGRFGTPAEAAELALSLARASSYLTGQIITLDGAWK